MPRLPEHWLNSTARPAPPHMLNGLSPLGDNPMDMSPNSLFAQNTFANSPPMQRESSWRRGPGHAAQDRGSPDRQPLPTPRPPSSPAPRPPRWFHSAHTPHSCPARLVPCDQLAPWVLWTWTIRPRWPLANRSSRPVCRQSRPARVTPLRRNRSAHGRQSPRPRRVGRMRWKVR